MKASPFEFCVGVLRESAVQVEPKLAILLGSWNGNVVIEDGRSVLTTECEGEMGTLGAFHSHTPSPAPGLD